MAVLRPVESWGFFSRACGYYATLLGFLHTRGCLMFLSVAHVLPCMPGVHPDGTAVQEMTRGEGPCQEPALQSAQERVLLLSLAGVRTGCLDAAFEGRLFDCINLNSASWLRGILSYCCMKTPSLSCQMKSMDVG